MRMGYVFLTTPTSGSASMLRILRTIGGPGIVLRQANGPASLEPGEGLTHLDSRRAHVLTWFRDPRHWNGALDLSGFRVIAHFRDPRDLACNQYWWALQHPNTHDTLEVAEGKRRKVEAGGLERYALNRSNAPSFDPLRALSDGPIGDAVTWTSYNQLCAAFDYMVDGLCRTFGRAPSAVAPALRQERPENLPGNPDWTRIGGTWKGSDVTPGRFRTELSPEGIEELTRKLGTELAFCRHRDAPFMRHHYD